MILEEYAPMRQVLHMVTLMLHLNVPAPLIVTVQVQPTRVMWHYHHQHVHAELMLLATHQGFVEILQKILDSHSVHA